MSADLPDQLMSLRAYARRRGVSHTAVMKAARTGRITLVGGKIDPARADMEWAQNTDEGLRRAAVGATGGRSAPKGHHKRAETGAVPDAAGAPPESIAYASARASREEYRAKLTALEYEAKRGALIQVTEVRELWLRLARRARDQLLALPDRLAVRLAGETDAAAVDQLLRTEVERICHDIARAGDP